MRKVLVRGKNGVKFVTTEEMYEKYSGDLEKIRVISQDNEQKKPTVSNRKK